MVVIDVQLNPVWVNWQAYILNVPNLCNTGPSYMDYSQANLIKMTTRWDACQILGVRLIIQLGFMVARVPIFIS